MKNHQRKRKRRKIKRNRRMTDSRNENFINRYKSEAKEATESILMDIMDQHGKDFSDYKEEVLDWSWDSITSE